MALTFSRLVVLTCLSALSASSSFAKEKLKVAFPGSFTSGNPNEVLTDAAMGRGAKAFFKLHPDAARAFELVSFDNKGLPEETLAQLAAMKRQGITVALGLSKSKQALVVNEAVQKSGMLLLTPFASHDKVTEGLSNVFRTCFSDVRQGRALAGFAVTGLKAKRVLILRNVDEPYTVNLAAKFIANLPQGFTTTVADYTRDDLRLSELPSLLATSSVDLIFIPDYASRAVSLMRAVLKAGYKGRFLGGDGWGSREILALLSEENGQQVQAYYSTHWHQDIDTPRNRAFKKAYAELYPDLEPTPGAAMMFDGLVVFWQALSSLKTEPTADALRVALRSGKFKVTTGDLEYTEADNTPSRTLAVVKIERGKHELHRLY